MGGDGPGAQFLDAVGGLGPPLLGALDAFAQVGRLLHPPRIPALRAAAAPFRERLEEALAAYRGATPPPEAADLARELERAAAHAARALALFCDSAPPSEGIARVLAALREQCLALEALYPLRRALPPVSLFFLEPGCRDRVDRLDPDPPAQEGAGLHRAGGGRDERGGFTLYVPESVAAGEARPLVVALHGGSGHGADFLWTWLREARSRRCLLLAPTARGGTWSLGGPDVDAGALRAMVELVDERFAVDRERVLLTGLSDGATYTLLCGLQEGMPFTALAPVSGVLHPANFANGNVGRARGRRIYLVHGALDWMFPVALARMARDELAKAGAEVAYREIEDLSHTYPREENAAILEWLDPGLRLSAAAPA